MNESEKHMKRRVLLSTDCGADMDDQWALALLAISPEFDLCGVVTTHAPTLDAEATARSAREVLDHMPLHGRKIPVIAGSSVPLADKATPLRNAGVDLIIQAAQGHSASNRLAVLAIGATTDVASALLVDPMLGERIEIVAMGFLSWPAGGEEFNIHNDLKAWQVLLESTAPIAVGDQAVCKKDLVMTPARAHELFDATGEPGRYLAHLLEAYIARDPAGIAMCVGKPNHWPIWDCVTVSHLLGLTKHVTYPRPALSDKIQFIHAQDIQDPEMARKVAGKTFDWITDVDSESLWAFYVKRLVQAQAGISD